MDVVETPVNVVEEIAVDMPVAGSDMVGSGSWIGSLRSKFSGYPDYLVDGVIFGVVGLIAGFLFKNFGRLFVIGVVATVIVLAAMSYGHLVSFNFGTIQSFFGITPRESIIDIVKDYATMITQNVPATLALIAGFFVGWKLG